MSKIIVKEKLIFKTIKLHEEVARRYIVAYPRNYHLITVVHDPINID